MRYLLPIGLLFMLMALILPEGFNLIAFAIGLPLAAMGAANHRDQLDPRKRKPHA